MKHKVGITFSCFDLLHAGHVAFLEQCKAQCEHLIVGLQTDPTLDRPEKNKPVQSIFERFKQVEALRYVDEIIPYATEADLIDVLNVYLPDVRFLGSDYIGKPYTGQGLVPTEFIPRYHSFSTTKLRETIYDAERQKRYKL